MVLLLSFLSVAKKSLDPKQKLASWVVLRNILTVIKWNTLGKDGLFFTSVYSLILNKLNCIISKLES